MNKHTAQKYLMAIAILIVVSWIIWYVRGIVGATSTTPSPLSEPPTIVTESPEDFDPIAAKLAKETAEHAAVTAASARSHQP